MTKRDLRDQGSNPEQTRIATPNGNHGSLAQDHTYTSGQPDVFLVAPNMRHHLDELWRRPGLDRLAIIAALRRMSP